MQKRIVLSLSGGLDSTSLLVSALAQGHSVQCVGFNYGQKHLIELDRAQSLVSFLVDNYALPVQFSIIELKGFAPLLVSGLITNGSQELLEGHYSHENARSSVVPNRNAIFASIIYAIALSEYKKHNEDISIALATHLGDFNNNTQTGTYPDCSEIFKISLEKAFRLGNWDSEHIFYDAPFNHLNKAGVLTKGLLGCNLLGIDYREIYRRTNTSYDPIHIDGIVYSDYKTGSSIERIEAFLEIGLEDPLIYADSCGPRSWAYVSDFVKSVCADHANRVKI